ncbi:MAG: AAA family ATPase [Anaerovoracaceae bacterium]
MMTIKEAAAVWGITERRVNALCKAGRISGAYKDGRQWMIPADARKPVDKRMKHPQPEAAEKRKKRLPLPIGISDYRKASCEYYYVDKTLLIRDFLDERPQVSLFTRPRRFGKTMNMDMIRTFFEKTDEDTSVYFRDKKIWSCGEEYRRYQGKYPVIYVTFKDVKCETWEITFDMISKILRNEFERHSELLESDRISPFEKKYITSVLNGDADENDIALSLLNLSRMLHAHHGTAPIIIIDEYDTPIQQGHMRGFYEKVIDFMRNLFSGGLKDNPHLSYGFLTGILRVAKESIFSGLNNLKINSILDDRYSEYFGFTSDEVQEMAEYYGACEKYPELCDWYDGYRFGGTEIFNPWSVIGYFNNQCRPKAFWQSTGSNDIISEVLSSATPDIMERLEALMQGRSFVTHIDTGVIYPQLQNNPSSVYSFLLVTGYLKAVNIDQPYGEDYMCEVALPNKEISFVYSKEILSQLESVIPPAAAIGIREAIYKMDLDELQTKLEKFLLETVSFHDAASESFYHGLILGLCAMLDDRYQITSNRESGEGRFDIQMAPLSERLPGILIELKSGKDCTEAQLESLSKAALQQINDRMYSTALKQQGVPSILKYGIAFSGKKVSIAAEIEKK